MKPKFGCVVPSAAIYDPILPRQEDVLLSIDISERALLARLNRALAKECTRVYDDVGRYYVVDLRTNSIAAKESPGVRIVVASPE